MRYRRRLRRQEKLLDDLPLTPLIDTALTLLIIFMITSPMLHNAIKVNLPQGKTKEDAGLQQDLVIYIDKDGQLFLNETKLALDDLLNELPKKVAGKADGTVYIKADQGVSYGCVIRVVDKIKVAGGVRYVALATKKHA